MTRLFFLIFFSTNFLQAQNLPESAYKQEVENWYLEREEDLKSEKGYLNIIGLFWLKEGDNNIGSSSENHLVFPSDKCDNNIGKLVLMNGNVLFIANQNSIVTASGNSINSKFVFQERYKDSTLVLTHKSLRFFVIKRGNKYGVRLRDLSSEAVKNFTHIDHFSINEKWKLDAVFEPALTNQTVAIKDVIGNTNILPLAGWIHFNIDGKEYKLEATPEGETNLFIVFSDETSGITTYGAGRFIDVERPKNGNKTIIDFNKCYNPACAFTAFATCPLPTIENRLPIEILAGEKNYGNH